SIHLARLPHRFQVPRDPGPQRDLGAIVLAVLAMHTSDWYAFRDNAPADCLSQSALRRTE
ncbi:MAG: hypothetical protein KDB23_34550, partial [Planctomycetales bacterium]|nr:hypothetical protein [Planctomycetales bacterium]